MKKYIYEVTTTINKRQTGIYNDYTEAEVEKKYYYLLASAREAIANQADYPVDYVIGSIDDDTAAELYETAWTELFPGIFEPHETRYQFFIRKIEISD